MKPISYLLFLLWLCYLIITSILLFTRGFLLSRTSLPNISSCLPHKEIPCSFEDLLNSNGDEKQCSSDENLSLLNEYSSAAGVCLPPKSKVVLLIIDALRYDFTLYDEKNYSPLPYQNKLPVIHKLLNQHPHSTRLYKFIADPPTTTMQRLKALTTGSLPTFIDAGSNFATPEINEDNIIDQLIKNNYEVVFMGDDTWNGLYPNRFIRNYPYPSFDVWDLDTVDNGVKQNLFPELNKTDWNLLIGHFLGVDHCGHRYGPNHPEMARKLKEINGIIEDVVQKMEENMMLFVIGDHGMTVTGDHGGESIDEITAGLFVYSKRELLQIDTNSDSVKQVDIVPTLSTILGIPIPFQNLGILILNCLPSQNYSLENFQTSLYYLWSNVQQMVEYIEEYSKTDKVFQKGTLEKSSSKYSLLKEKLSSVTDQHFFLEFYKNATNFMGSMRMICEQVWVQFEPFLMARGLLFLFLSMFFIFLITDGIPIDRLPEIFMSSFLMCSYTALFVAAAIGSLLYYLKFAENLLLNIFFATGLISQLMLVMLILQNWELISLNWYSKSRKERIPNLICRLVLVFNLCGLFSNSYIIEESFVLSFLLVTVIMVGSLGIISPDVNIDSKKKNSSKIWKWSKLKLLLLAVIVAVLVRVSMYFWQCREEQQWCFDSPHEFGTVTKVETTKLQWAVTVIFLTVLVFSTKEWLKSCGNLNGYAMTVTFFKLFPAAIVVCISGYWALKNMPVVKKTTHPLRSINSLACASYGMISFGIIYCILKPLCVFVMPSRESLQREENIIPNLFRKIKTSLKRDSKDVDEVPIVCGLATVYSAVFIIIGLYLTLLFALLLGDRLAPTAVIMFVTSFFVLLITSIIRIENSSAMEQLFDVPNISILIWIILAQYFFYGTGHQPTFPNIAWEAAFVGTTGVSTNNIIPATLIILNTFCSYIIMGILLPLVLIIPFTIFVMIPSVTGKKTEMRAVIERGEIVLFEKNSLMMASMFTISSKYIIGHGIRVFASMLAATIHCRHLMVWRIFAPKLIFESIGMFVTLVSVMTSYLILMRINRKVEALIIQLNKMS